MTARHAVLVAFICVALGSAVQFVIGQGKPVPTVDLTVLLDGDILREGGTVFILPRTVPVSNEASTGAGRTVAVTATNPFSILRFDRAPGVSYVYRFDRAPGAFQDAGRTTTTELIGVGDGGYLDDTTSNFVEIEQIETVYISGRSATKADSQERRIELTKVLRAGVTCLDFSGAEICVPAAQKGDPVPVRTR